MNLDRLTQCSVKVNCTIWKLNKCCNFGPQPNWVYWPVDKAQVNDTNTNEVRAPLTSSYSNEVKSRPILHTKTVFNWVMYPPICGLDVSQTLSKSHICFQSVHLLLLLLKEISCLHTFKPFKNIHVWMSSTDKKFSFWVHSFVLCVAVITRWAIQKQNRLVIVSTPYSTWLVWSPSERKPLITDRAGAYVGK